MIYCLVLVIYTELQQFMVQVNLVLADRFRIKDREEIYGPFRLEMMLVYFVRQFTFDQVNHVAKSKKSKKSCKT